MATNKQAIKKTKSKVTKKRTKYRKISLEVTPAKVAAPKNARKSSAGLSSRVQLQRNHWQKEVANLQSRQFTTVDKAVEAIIEQVLGRLKGLGNDKGEARQFLLDIFGTDPGLKRELTKLLKVGA